MDFEFTATDAVTGDSTLEVWGEGSRVHFVITDNEGKSMSIYLRNGVELASRIIASSWGYVPYTREK